MHPWPKQVVSKIERGGRDVSASELLALALVFQCPIGVLLHTRAESVWLGEGAAPGDRVRPLLGPGVVAWDLDRLEQHAAEVTRDANEAKKALEALGWWRQTEGSQ